MSDYHIGHFKRQLFSAAGQEQEICPGCCYGGPCKAEVCFSDDACGSEPGSWPIWEFRRQSEGAGPK